MKPKIIGQNCGFVVVQTEKNHIVGFRPIDREMYESYVNLGDDALDYLKEIWIEEVQNYKTDQSLEEWAEELIDADGEDIFWDCSYENLWDILREAGFNEDDFPVFNCVLCGYYDPSKEKYDKFNPKDYGIVATK